MQWFGAEEHQPFHFGSGPVGALLIHGYMGTPAELRPLGHALEAAGIAATAPLLPGFGSDLPRLSRVGVKDWVAGAAEAWEAVTAESEQAVLIGFSMGAAVAISLAVQRPPDRLILLAPFWKLLGGDWRVALLPVIKHVVRSVRPFARSNLDDPELRQFFAEAIPGLNLHDPAVRAQVRRGVRLQTATLDELRRMGASAGKLAPRITAPALVIQGQDDQTVLARDTRALAGRFGGPTMLREVPGGHMLVLPNPDNWPAVPDRVVRFAAGAPV